MKQFAMRQAWITLALSGVLIIVAYTTQWDPAIYTAAVMTIISWWFRMLA